MARVIKLKKGLDIPLQGAPQRGWKSVTAPVEYALMPDDFRGVVPRMLLKEGEPVKIGTPLFFDKNHPEVRICSPVSGYLKAVVRGEKRKILRVVVAQDPSLQPQFETFMVEPLSTLSRPEIIRLMLESGLWPMMIQRPYGMIADTLVTPNAIFVSGFDSAPLAPDMNFLLADQAENLQAGFQVLTLLSGGSVHLGLRAGEEGVLHTTAFEGVEHHLFAGPHPAGNVGVQIHHIDPIAKNDVVWSVDVQHVAMIGRFFLTGRPDFSCSIALTGSEIASPGYVRTVVGASLTALFAPQALREEDALRRLRYIDGNVLTGRGTELDGYLGYYARQLTVIPEGDHYELLGWGRARLNKFSVSHSYFSWLMPWRRYVLDANLNGGRRAFVVTGLYDRYLPMDIYPLYLLKAILAGDIDKMESLGIYEVLPEDLALCEFVDPSKQNIQAIVRDGIELMRKELN